MVEEKKIPVVENFSPLSLQLFKYIVIEFRYVRELPFCVN
jgi:hypothetical protein